MSREAGSAIDPDCFEAMRQVLMETSRTESDAATPAVRVVPGLLEDYRQAA